jgi:hypothetical protein
VKATAALKLGIALKRNLKPLDAIFSFRGTLGPKNETEGVYGVFWGILEGTVLTLPGHG